MTQPTDTPPSTTPDIYSPAYVAALFDEMSKTYGVVNLISSFGFCLRWRRQCLEQIEIKDGAEVYDLMSGMGELWRGLARRSSSLRITGIELSAVMCGRSQSTAEKLRSEASITAIRTDALNTNLPSNSADAIVSTFGLKTFSQEQQGILAAEIARLLRPGGQFSLLEISVPRSAALRWPYMFYLRFVIPIIGWLFMGNPQNYRMLGIYTAAFGDSSFFEQALRQQGLNVAQRKFFFGCASGVCGFKPR